MRFIWCILAIVLIGVSNAVISNEQLMTLSKIQALHCHICEHLKYSLQTQQRAKFASIGWRCEDRLPDEICHALKKTSSNHAQIRMQQQEACVPGFCAKYSAEVSCAILKKLIHVGKANKAQPEPEFMRRLQLTCTQLDFLDPPCGMIVDEYGEKIYEVTLQDIPEDQACKQFGICPPDQP